MKKHFKLVDIVGARPQFIKLAPILKAIDEHNRENPDNSIVEILVHTGQHYDYRMSDVFFDELGLKSPDYHLGVGSGTHGYQTGEMIKKIEEVLLLEKPDLVMVYGDTNSTLAGAIAASKLHIPVAHVEAGLRSYNLKMPEEINRVLTDHCSTILFCPTKNSIDNLIKEGFTNIFNNGEIVDIESILNFKFTLTKPLVLNVGDVMYDALLQYLTLAEQQSSILKEFKLVPKSYALATIHRAENTDNPNQLKRLFEFLINISNNGLPIILPLHPRTQKQVENFNFSINGIKVVKPLSYLDMLLLEKNASIIFTDSGGIQKEAFFLQVPCVTLREETEWVETIKSGWNVLYGNYKGKHEIKDTETNFYGDGKAGNKITKILTFLTVI